MARRTTSTGRSGPKDNTLTRPGLVVDIGPNGEIVPRWQRVSIFTPVARGNPRGPILQLGLVAN